MQSRLVIITGETGIDKEVNGRYTTASGYKILFSLVLPLISTVYTYTCAHTQDVA